MKEQINSEKGYLQETNTEGIPIKIWTADIEEGAIKQLENLAKLPFAFKHVSAMPDCHQGYGMPIGGVLATKGVVIPNAVGVDIGCGMLAIKTSLTDINKDTLKSILGTIRQTIPVGFNKHKEMQDIKLMPNGKSINDLINTYPGIGVVESNYGNARLSLGTLGGGNHFIEIQKGDDGHIWVMIHSGSRNLGKQVADYYNKVAKKLNKKWFSEVKPEWELAFLPLESEEGRAYLREMNYCLEFAKANREHMMHRVMEIIVKKISDFRVLSEINIHHNYAVMENHFGQNVMIHRKGATSAKDGEYGIIPGSQGSSSYIVKGKGNIWSFKSCSHGAGRKMGRKEAQRTLNLDEEIKILNDQGIIHNITSAKQLDEASGSYKDIHAVMKNQEDLVNIVVKLKPLGVVKG